MFYFVLAQDEIGYSEYLHVTFILQNPQRCKSHPLQLNKGNSWILNSYIRCQAHLKGLVNTSSNVIHALIPVACARRCSSLLLELLSLEEGDSVQIIFTSLCFCRCTMRSQQ